MLAAPLQGDKTGPNDEFNFTGQHLGGTTLQVNSEKPTIGGPNLQTNSYSQASRGGASARGVWFVHHNMGPDGQARNSRQGTCQGTHVITSLQNMFSAKTPPSKHIHILASQSGPLQMCSKKIHLDPP